jgi:hypothetical protein
VRRPLDSEQYGVRRRCRTGLLRTTWKRRYDELYERYERPLEREHQGEYVAISPKGDTILGQTPHEAAQRAVDQFGPGSFLFKIGDRVVGQARSLRW